MNRFFKITYTFALGILLPAVAYSKPVSVTEALDRIFSEKSTGMMKKQPVKAKTTLSHTFTSQAGTPVLYAISKG